jgi:uncharacterized repeat protein (TIGR01451 family)
MTSKMSPRRRALGVAVVGLVGFSLLVPGAASAGVPPPSADLKTTITDSPDPVNEQNNVTYLVHVTNLGPDTANNVVLNESIPFGTTLVAFDGTGFACEESGGGALRGGPSPDVVCTTPTLASDATASASFTVRTSTISKGSSETITAFVSVSADEFDPNSSNNNKNEDTTVVPRDPNMSTGSIPPQGGTINTDIGAPGPDPVDSTVLRMKFPTGPGGEATLIEEDCTGTPLAPCIGNLGNFQPPPGYDQLLAVFLFDGSLDPGKPKGQFHVFYQERDGSPVIDLPRCNKDPGAPHPPPCILQIRRIEPQNWLRARVRIDSDPRVVTR